ncbi:hypothetical protein ASZ90_002213 [hydrocarbon metagenome]|uniref:Uncharacterized protein n=1 Tax=hydrocarbon metagenome TaxID=938273 RepID=A0A0W8G408_9ZZZZ
MPQGSDRGRFKAGRALSTPSPRRDFPLWRPLLFDVKWI